MKMLYQGVLWTQEKGQIQLDGMSLIKHVKYSSSSYMVCLGHGI